MPYFDAYCLCFSSCSLCLAWLSLEIISEMISRSYIFISLTKIFKELKLTSPSQVM